MPRPTLARGDPLRAIFGNSTIARSATLDHNLSRSQRVNPTGGSTMPKRSRIVHDEMSGMLEQYVRPHLEAMRREFYWEYLQIYQRWAEEQAAIQLRDDQQILGRLADHAEHSLRAIAEDKPVTTIKIFS